MRIRRRIVTDDSGAMLLIALIVITTVAVVTGAILSHAYTSLRATVSLRGVAGTSYAADTAAKIAIDNLRLGASAAIPGATYPSSDWVYSNNTDGTGCFGLSGSAPKYDLVLPQGFYPKAGSQTGAPSSRVDCSVVPGTGLFGGGGGVENTDQNNFIRAITVFQGPLEVFNNSVLQVRGGIASNGVIDASNAAGTGIFTNGYVWANEGCSGSITSTPAKDCNHAEVNDPQIADVFTTTAGLPVRNATAQSCGAFQPGYYSSAAVLNAKVNSCGTAIFAPGNYYFDFQDEALGSGTNVWSIDNTVIGGEMIGAGDPPGRCRSPIDDPTADGVRFVFGGTSRMNIGQNAHVELCGSYSETAPPVVLQQQMTNYDPGPPPPAVFMTAGTVTTPGSDGTWAPTEASGLLDEAFGADGGPQGQWAGPGNNKRAIAKLENFSAAPNIPTGSIVSTAVARIKHRETITGSLTLTVANGTGAGLITKDYTVSANAALDWDDIDIAADFAPAITAGTFAPTVTIKTQAAKDATAVIDAVQIKVQSTPLALHAASAVDFIGGFGNSFKGDFVLQGSVYAPLGNVTVNFGNNNDTVVAFRYGMAVREAHLAGHPQVLYGYPLVSIPDKGVGLNKRVVVVDLKVSVCVESASCATGGTHVLTARVAITDPPWTLPDGHPTPGQRQVRILSWSEQN